MLTIIDSAGNMLTLDDEALTVVEIDSRIHNWRADHGTLVVPEFTVTLSHPRPEPRAYGFAVNPTTTIEAPWKIHAPPPTSARWEGPAPKQRRGAR
jgi:hypothetical protein